jgi:hypothetical protein
MLEHLKAHEELEKQFKKPKMKTRVNKSSEIVDITLFFIQMRDRTKR